MSTTNDTVSVTNREHYEAASLLNEVEPCASSRAQASDMTTTEADARIGAGVRASEFGEVAYAENMFGSQSETACSPYALKVQEYGANPVYEINEGFDFAGELCHVDARDQTIRPDSVSVEDVARETSDGRFIAHVHIEDGIKKQMGSLINSKDDISESGEADEELVEHARGEADALFNRTLMRTGVKQECRTVVSKGHAFSHTGSAAAAGSASQQAAVKAAAHVRYTSATYVRIANSGKAALSAASRAVKAFSTGGAAAGETASSPWLLLGLAILALFALILVGSAGCMTLLGGQDDNSTGSLTSNQAIVASYLLGKGLDKTHVAAIMGNMDAESGIDPDRVEDGGDGHGLCQWSFGRYVQLRDYAASKGKEWSDIQVQLDFLWAELTGEGPAAAFTNVQYDHAGFMQTSDLDECVIYFGRNFERPNEALANWERRKESARRFLLAMSQSGSTLSWAMAIAEDDSIGYSWGCARPGEYDCQGLIKAALSQAGENVTWSYTGDMSEGLIAAGYKRHAYLESELQPGDILLYHFSSGSDYSGHTALWIGDGRIVEAINDNDGVAGDSDGNEIRITSNWADGLWQSYFRKAA